MKTKRVIVKRLVMVIVASMLMQSALIMSSVSAQEPPLVDINQDGIDDNEPALPFTIADSAMVPNQQTGGFSIGMIETGQYQYPRDRLVSLGYSVTTIPPTSGLSAFLQYDIVYLPVQWAQPDIGAFDMIESHANDYHNYVFQGGGLFVEQPMYDIPNQIRLFSLLILPYLIGFQDGSLSTDYPPLIVDPNHFITEGLTAGEMPFPANPMYDVDPFYQILVVGGTSGQASLVVGEYGAGRILVQTDSPSRTALYPFSDTVYIRMIEWVGNSSNSCSPDTFEPDDTSATSSPIIFGEIQRHTLCPQNDQDWVNFQTTDLQPDLLVETFDLEPDSINPNGDTQLTVKDSSGNQIGTNQNRGVAPLSGSSQPTVKSSRVAWHSATNGLFNINIFPEIPISGQADTGYSLHMANPFLLIDPAAQGSWAPTKVNVPTVWRSGGNVIYFSQMFVFEQAELDALINLNTTFAWEFRRPAVDTDTGQEQDSNVDFGDYWKSRAGVCVGDYFTNLPNPTDKYSEESNSITGCRDKNEIGPWDDEEFEVFVEDPSALIAGKVYYVVVKFYIHDSYLNNTYQFYIAKAEHCKKQSGPFDALCNFLPGQKSSANLIEGFLQPAP